MMESAIIDSFVAPIKQTSLIPSHDNKQEVVKLLLQAQADKTLDDGDGKKAVDLAKSKGHGAVEKLLKHGLNGDEGGSEGCVIA